MLKHVMLNQFGASEADETAHCLTRRGSSSGRRHMLRRELA
jgi:hypothetical protein